MQFFLSYLNLSLGKPISWLIVVLFLTSFTNGLAAKQKNQTSSSKEKRIALVIGNSDYSFSPLINPANDAKDISTALRKKNFDVIQILDATLEQIDTAINDFGKKLSKADVGLFFYAGHGIQANGRNYIIPVDAVLNKQSDLKYRAVDVGQVLDEMAYANSGINIVILDACRNNSLPRSFRSSRRGLAIVSDSPKGTFIAYSTAPGKVAADGEGRNSPYSEALIAALDIKQASLERVFKEVARKVEAKTGGKQMPWVSSSVTGDFYFNLTINVDSPAKTAGSKKQSAADKSDLIELKFWESIEKNPSREKYQLYLKRYPKGYFADIAKMEVSATQNKKLNTSNQLLIKDKLNQCNLYLRRNQLTTGAGGNAYDCYHDVLQTEPDNTRARQGLLNIERKYKKWTTDAIEDGLWQKAKRYLQKVIQVNPNSSDIKILKEQINIGKNRLLMAKSKADKKPVKTEKPKPEKVIDDEEDLAKMEAELFGNNFYNEGSESAPIKPELIPAAKTSSSVAQQNYSIDSALIAQIEKNMLPVQPGCFDMGQNSKDNNFTIYQNASVKGYGKSSDNFTHSKHQVCLTRDFYISKFEVTQKVWQAVMNNNPSQFRSCGENCPVERVSWRDVQKFIKRLNANSTMTFRLPTEAEWEYIARAKTETKAESHDIFGAIFNSGSSKKTPNFKCRSASTSPVGVKKPNAWGIYDVYGNVWEWVADWYGSYPGYKVVNPTGPGRGAKRVIRGGSWLNSSKECNAYVRKGSPPFSKEGYIGFRLAADK